LLIGSANTSEAARRHADLVIKPRAEAIGLLEFHQLDAAREAGRVAAREALEHARRAVRLKPGGPDGERAAIFSADPPLGPGSARRAWCR
jgi:predicted acylesterase/phospholipase RssA